MRLISRVLVTRVDQPVGSTPSVHGIDLATGRAICLDADRVFVGAGGLGSGISADLAANGVRVAALDIGKASLVCCVQVPRPSVIDVTTTPVIRLPAGRERISAWMVWAGLFQAGMAQYDHVHFTGAGYRMLGDAVFRDIMSQYDIFLKARADIVAEVAAGSAAK